MDLVLRPIRDAACQRKDYVSRLLWHLRLQKDETCIPVTSAADKHPRAVNKRTTVLKTFHSAEVAESSSAYAGWSTFAEG